MSVLNRFRRWLAYWLYVLAAAVRPPPTYDFAAPPRKAAYPTCDKCDRLADLKAAHVDGRYWMLCPACLWNTVPTLGGGGE